VALDFAQELADPQIDPRLPQTAFGFLHHAIGLGLQLLLLGRQPVDLGRKLLEGILFHGFELARQFDLAPRRIGKDLADLLTVPFHGDQKTVDLPALSSQLQIQGGHVLQPVFEFAQTSLRHFPRLHGQKGMPCRQSRIGDPDAVQTHLPLDIVELQNLLLNRPLPLPDAGASRVDDVEILLLRVHVHRRAPVQVRLA